MNVKDLYAVRETVDALLITFRDTDARLSQVINKLPENQKDNEFFTYVCLVRHAIKQSLETFHNALNR